MAMKRKRHLTSFSPCKRPRKILTDRSIQSPSLIQHSALNSCYANVCSLGKILDKWLPGTSRIRRKRLRQFGTDHPSHAGILEQIVVCYSARTCLDAQLARRDELLKFTQTQRGACRNSHQAVVCNVGEIVDFAIWALFRRDTNASRTPSHVLCQGFQRAASLNDHRGQSESLRLPGIVQRTCNANVDSLKRSPWTDIANILGTDAEMIILSLLLDCALFQQLETGRNNLYQFSGEPVTLLIPRVGVRPSIKPVPKQSSSQTIKSPGSITFVRNRMYHARPSLNAQGKVLLGLKHVHILNRCRALADVMQDIRIMQYIFPRQFGLHNVFTSKVNSNETVQPLKDYTMREDEFCQLDQKKIMKVPRRLRGAVMTLIRKIRRNHQRCSYNQLLRHYCPVFTLNAPPLCPSSGQSQVSGGSTMQFVTQSGAWPVHSTYQTLHASACTTSLLPHATPTSQITAFCQAIISRILPRDILGSGPNATYNWSKLLYSIDQFIGMRRFESVALHEVCQGMKIRHIEWLSSPLMQHDSKMSASDRSKRLEIFHELIYYIFDSLLIPLIRSNFYVTETGSHRYRLYYFRHDVWKKMTDPSLATMRLSMFQPLNRRQIKHMYDMSNLGNSHMRLLPKKDGVRPIVNLRRRTMKMINGRQVLGPSINTQLAPIYSVLNLERLRQPERQASALFSVGEIREKLRRFKARLDRTFPQTFYFVKVDICSAFDTIPQNEMIMFLQDLLLEEQYQVTKHAEMKQISATKGAAPGRLVSRFVFRSLPARENSLFTAQVAAQLAISKRQHVFVGQEQDRIIPVGQVRKILTNHLKGNVVRIGRKHFKQVGGIPQGSVLSSLLCNLFYGDFERKELSFLDPGTSLLLRLIDDFLLITTDESQARQFVEAMSRKHVKYGIVANAEKSLVNFEVSINGHKVPRLHGVPFFPYCGMTVDTRDLQVRKERQPRDSHVQNGLTVSRSGRIGATLQTKVVSSLKRQMHTLLLDGSLNTRTQVMNSIFECFVETAMKMHQHLRCLPKRRRPSQEFIVHLCGQLADAGFRLFRNAQVHERVQLSRPQMTWLAAAALSEVLKRKQSEYSLALSWLCDAKAESSRSMGMNTQELGSMVRGCMDPFVKHYTY